MRFLPSIIVGAIACANTAGASEADAKAARVMWSAFECSRFAGMAGMPEEVERLFTVGLQAGRQFMAAVEAGTISNDEAKAVVPLGVSLLMSGPSNDFVIGRIYESAIGLAFDSVVKEDSAGLPLPTEEWVNDRELETSIAKNRYLKSNCAVF